MRIATWNIGGGRIIDDDGNYSILNLDYFIQELKKIDADIICLQETHKNKNYDQNNLIAKELGYHYVSETHCISYLDNNFGMALGIMSKKPISSSELILLSNPKLENKEKKWISDDKGFLKTIIAGELVLSGHMLPFHHFNRNFSEDEFKNIRFEIKTIISKASIVGVDMNFDDLSIFNFSGFKMPINQATIPKGIQQDHLLVSEKFQVINQEVISGKADHYLCYIDIKK